MTGKLEQILWQTWQRLEESALVLLPNVLAMLLIVVAGWIAARLAQWALQRMSTRLDGWLLRWGLADGYGQPGTARILARGAFWTIFGCAILVGINALNTQLGSRLATSALLYLPRLLTAGVIVVAGLLLGRYLARSVLIWAVNEGIGPARWIAAGVRAGVGFLTFVAAAEQLDVARTAALTTFVILLSGTVLSLALALGLGSRKRVEHWLERRAAFLAEERSDVERIDHV